MRTCKLLFSLIPIWLCTVHYQLVNSMGPGITVAVTDKALAYFSTLAGHSVPKVVEGVMLPDQSGSSWSIKHIYIAKVDRPEVETNYVQSRGVITRMRIPQIILRGRYSVGFHKWFRKSGDLTAIVKNFILDVIFTIHSGEIGETRVKIEECAAEMGDTRVEFNGGWSALMNSASNFIEDYLRREINSLLCSGAHQTAQEYEKGFDLKQTRSKRSVSSESSSKQSFSDSYSMNLSMSEAPHFYDTIAAFKFNGTMLYKGKPAFLGNATKFPTPGFNRQRMLTIIVAETVPNSFFTHAFEQGLTEIDQAFSMKDLPPAYNNILLNAACRNCSARLRGGLNMPPDLKVSRENGINLNLNGWVRTTVSMFWRQLELFLVTAKLKANVYPYLNKDRLVADTLLDAVHLDINNLGYIMSFFKDDIIKSLTYFVQSQLAAPVENGLKSVLGESGVPLPKLYGIRFLDPDLHYIDHGLVIETDLEYDPTETVNHLRDVVHNKVMRRLRRRSVK